MADASAAKRARVEDLYPLTPLQHGLLFHSLYAPASGVYAEQLSYVLAGDLDRDAFRAAWEHVVARHAILRTGFATGDLKEPLQVVRPRVELPWTFEDWRGLRAEERVERLEALATRHRHEPFDVVRAPLMRMALLRFATDSYRFVWTFHHVLLDGWSVALLLREVQTAYAALRLGAAPDLPQPRPFRDFIAWLKAQDPAAAERFWRERLADLEEPTSLGIERTWAVAAGEDAEDEPVPGIRLGEETTAALRALASSHDVTLNTVVQGAWAVLLSRYSGSEDVVYGTTSAGRPASLPGSESMIGLFINTLPVRARVRGLDPFVPFVKELQSAQVEQREFEYTPLVELQKWTGVPGGTPLFDTVFVFENYPVEPASDGGGIGLEVQRSAHHTMTNYLIALACSVDDRSIAVDAVFDRKRADRAAVQTLLGCLERLLEAIADDAERPIGLLPMLAPSEVERVTGTFNRTSAEHEPLATGVHELVESWAARTPDAVAVVADGACVTYGELNRRANRLARHLRDLGVETGDRVGICLRRSLETVVGLLGTMKAGAAYLPLDPTYPPERLAWMVEDAAPRAVVTSGKDFGGLEDRVPEVVRLDRDAEAIAARPAHDLPGVVTPRCTAYVIYTSGSTGRPKGVEIPHEGLANLVAWHDEAYRVTPDDAASMVASLSFDASVWELWPHLAAGARVCIADDETRISVEALAGWLTREGVTVSFLPTPVCEAGLAEGILSDVPVRALLTGGDRLRRPPGAGLPFELVNHYGPTEYTVVTTCGAVDPELADGPPPIGGPIDNTRVYVVERSGTPVPVGVPGELCVGGAQLAHGYLARPGLTAERFVPDPFGPEGARLYRTGDLVRWLPTGAIEFLGRIDHQVKIRGFRIELGEVETVLGRAEGVRDVVVIAAEDGRGGQRLVGYVVAEGTDAEALRAHAAERLPEHMVPSALVFLDELPLTPNGKIDRRRLPEPGVDEAAPHVEPATEHERILADVWRDVLGVERVGAEDDFFALGGHSLLATQVVGRLGKAFDVDLPLRLLFEHPTVRRLARAVEELKAGGSAATAPPIVPLGPDRAVPLSFAQERLWFLEELTPGQSAYVVPLALRLDGPLHESALADAFREVVRRHESLRTVFERARDGTPVQIVTGGDAIRLRSVDLSGLPEALGDEAVRALVAREAGRPFDLTAGPLVRGVVTRLAPERHVVLFSAHHAVTDGWSSGLLVSEIASLYDDFVAGRESGLTELPIQYRDYAAWQREWLEAGALHTQLDYWTEQLAGAPELLELPTDRPRPSVQGSAGARVPVELGGRLVDALGALSREEGVTLFMTLVATFQALLHRYSGQDDILVGTPVAGRRDPALDPLVGLFVNTVVLRAQLGDDPTFRELLEAVRETALAAYANQDLPFERLVDELHVHRDLSRSPLFQVLFILQNEPAAPARLTDVDVTRLEPEHDTAKFDLTLDLAEGERGIGGVLDYSTDLFDAVTIDRLLAHYRALLEAVVEDPDRRVSELPLLSDEERHGVVETWNETERAYPRDLCIHDLFEQRASETPDAVALVAGGRQLTYRELDQRAGRLAERLRGLGVGPDGCVGVCLPRSADLVVGLLAILKAGGAYVPLDPGYPRERLEVILEDAGVVAILTQSDLLDRVGARAEPVVLLDRDREGIAKARATPRRTAVTPESLAYVTFTSGSTGRPKGVQIPHRAVVNFLTTMAERPGLDATDTLASVTTISFDISVLELFLPLVRGARLVLVDSDTARDGRALGSLVDAWQTTVLQGTPATWQLLLETGWGGRPGLRALCGGQALTDDLAERVGRHAGSLWNMYGPTETTIWSTVDQVELGAGPVTIGRPIANTRVYIADRNVEPVPVGVAGELLIGGDGVSRGYRGRPDLTAERFIPDPYDARGGGRLYRTGDRVRYGRDGRIGFMGRIDHQVKIRGFRIELGEIENTLARLPQVQDVVVVTRRWGGADERIAAYVVPSEAGDGSGDRAGTHSTETDFVSGLRDALRETLPEYMVPSAFVLLDALPLLPNGKVSRGALPEPTTGPTDDAAHVAPRNETERVLAAIWSDVLGLERVGVHDDFFLLGGHSLIATRLVSRVRDELGVEYPLRRIFEAPTVAGMAADVGAAGAAAPGARAPLERTGRTEDLPLSHAQERLWFIDRFEPGSAAYNIPSAVRVSGRVDAAALSQALTEIVRRHWALRSAFSSRDGRPTQHVAPPPVTVLRAVDLTGLPESERTAAARACAEAEAAKPFDLERPPLIRGALVTLGPDEHLLLITVHHIVSDAWSAGILVAELADLYDRLGAGVPSALDELPVQLADYALWQRAWADSGGLDGELAYWRDRLAGVTPTLDLPTDRPRPAVQTFRGGETPVRLGAELSAEVTRLSERHGVTPFMTLLAGFFALLRRYSGQDDLVVGSPIAGRSRSELEGLIGFFANTLAMRADVHGDPTVAGLLDQVRETALGAYAHQEVPLEKLLDELDVPRDLSRTPLFQVVFALQNAPVRAADVRGARLEPVTAAGGTAKFDLTLILGEGADGFAGVLEYASDLFEEATVQRMARHLRRVLEGMVADPAARISELSLLDDQERDDLVMARNATATPYPEASIQEVFEARADDTPDAVALVSEGRSVTYRELDRRANRLAHRLLDGGLEAEGPVGVFVERGPEMVVALLGVLKAGGVYVPLDADYPTSRLEFMARDAGLAALLVTEEPEERFVDADVPVLRIGEEPDRPDARPASRSGPDSLAYVIYTSGSTGTPKGVSVPHRGVLRLLFGGTYARLDGSLVVPHLSSPTFDASTLEVWAPLLHGGRLVLHAERLPTPKDLGRLIGRHRVTTMWLTSSLFNAVVDEGVQHLSGLRELLIGGEALSPSHVQRAQRALTGTQIINGYGPTESTTFTCCHRIPTGFAADRPIPIGRPIGNTQVYVLDERMEPAPEGVEGDFFIGGAGLARCYLSRPALTAEAFVPDPVSGRAGARMYRTGDRARHIADGLVDFLGRRDHQVKMRGFRIELGEIESALLDDAAVNEAAVLVREDVPGVKRLVAYLVEAPDRTADVEALRSGLTARLPEYMVPGAFVVLDAFPLTPNGKLDRRALPAPDDRAGTEAGFVAPRGREQEILAGIWSELLGVERVGAHDNFFELGGDSILSIQIVSRANEAGLGISPKDLFQHQTIAELAAAAGSARETDAEQGPVVGSVPLTPIQRWFLERPPHDPHHFNQAVLLEAKEPVDVDRLEAAVAALLEHHDALRLRYRHGAGGWSQEIAPPLGPVPFRATDLSDVPEAERERALARKIAVAHASLDLEQGPLVRVEHFRLGTGRSERVSLVVHHLAVDGVSWRILLEDLQTAYEQLVRGDAVRLPAKTTSYKSWAERLAARAADDPLEAERAYWSDDAWAEVRDLPVDHPDGANTVASRRAVVVTLDQAETATLLTGAHRAYRTRIDDLLLTALHETLGAWTGSDRVLVNLEGHGREELFDGVDLSRTVGWFTALYPVLLDADRRAGPGARIRAIKEQLRAVPGRGVGYGLLKYLANGEGSGDACALPDARVGFNYLGQVDQVLGSEASFAIAPEDSGPAEAGGSERAHLLDVTGIVHEGRLRLTIQYGAEVHDAATIQGLADSYLGSLRALIGHCASEDVGGYTPSDFPLARLTQAQVDALLGPERGVEDVYPASPTQQGMLFHSLFEPASGVYVSQIACTLLGPLDEGAFLESWRRVIARHSVLRTSFHMDLVERPVQVVHETAEATWDGGTWGPVDDAGRRERLERYLAGVRARGFQVDRVPLMRLGLFSCGPDEHVFAWSHHHTLLDGWSVPIVLGEAMTIYEGLRSGTEPDLPAAPPYRAYIAWLEERDLSEAERFWRATLAGFEEPTPLPAASVRREAEAADGYAERTAELDEDVTSVLVRLAREHQLTVSTVVQGAWAALLARYAGSADVVFGTTVSGRPPDLPGSDAMVGLFINTVPSRARLDEAASWVEWLGTLQADQVEARQYEYTPLVEVQRWSELAAGTPLFETLVVFENYPVGDELTSETRDLSIGSVHTAERTNYPLTLFASPGARLALRLGYDTGRWEEAAADRLLDQLLAVLAGIAQAPEAPLGSAPLVSDEQRRTILESWNDTAATYDEAVCVHDLFARRVGEAPDAVALVTEAADLTYRELDRRSGQVARHLRGLGVGPEVCVGVCLPRSAEMVVTLLGILKAGGAYVPLDPDYPAERLAVILEDAGVGAIVTQADLIDRVGETGVPVVRIDDDWDGIAGAQPFDAPSGVTSESLAYVTFTSGSTGRPKGVQITHRSVVNFLSTMARRPGLDAGDVFLSVTTISFDISVLELFLPLVRGGRLAVVSRDTARDGRALARALERTDATVMQGTPATWRLVLEADWRGKDDLVVLCGGQALAEDLARALVPASASLWNMYGPTETTIWSMVDEISDPEAPITIGRPIANTQVYVVDRVFRLLPVAAAGELLIGGDGVSRGYRGRPDLTAERFVPDPYGEAGARVYRTGDRVAYLPDGRVGFLGRIDDQVKIRGFRIELAEIENALGAHERIHDAVVVAREAASGRDVLCAYYVATEDGPAPAPSDLRSFVARALPEYMVPSVFVPLEALPLTPNGKVDRRALPTPDGALVEVEHVAPRTPYEEIVADVWRDVLRLDRVGVRESFFELGGHSLLAAQVISRLRATFEVDVPVRHLFEADTVEGLAARLEGLVSGGGASAAPPVEAGVHEGPLPLSFAQERLWFLDQLEPGSHAYNLSAPMRLTGVLDTAALEQAFAEILRRHLALRATFQVVVGEPRQVVGDPPRRVVSVVDVSGLPDAARETAARAIAAREAVEPFDLARGPLMRVTLVRIAPEEHVALLTMHHVVSDGWSMGVLVRELTALYDRFSEGRASSLSELAVQYCDYAVWQRSWLESGPLGAQLDYWRDRLAGVEPLDLPTDRPRPAVQTFHGASEPVALPQALSERLLALGRAAGTTPFMTLLAGFQALLHRYTGQSDVAVGTPIAGRGREEVEELIGFFANTLVLRADLADDPTFRELLGRTREAALGAFANQDVPFERLVGELGVQRELSRSPLFDVMFVLQNNRLEELRLAEVSFEPVVPDRVTSKFDLTLTLAETPTGLRGSVEYNTDLFDAETILRLIEGFEELLGSAVARPDAPISDLSAMTATQRALVVEEWNRTAVDYPHAPYIHRLFEERVDLWPDATALVYGSESLSFREVNERANRLARHLRTLGVGPDVLVGLYVGRSLEMLVGLLAILKAGGAYVPMDRDYPAQRRAYMLEDSGARVLLTSSAWANEVESGSAELVFLDRVWDEIADLSAADLEVGLHGGNTAFVIYTSGSTGLPKGVAMSHGALANLIFWELDRSELGAGRRSAQFASVSFDASFQDMFLTWCSGGTLVVVPEEERRDATRLPAFLVRNEIERINVPFVALQQLAEVADTIGPVPVQLAEVITAGEQLQITAPVAALFQALGDCPLENYYGPTEGHVVTAHRLDGPVGSWPALPPIGHAVKNVELYVLDGRLRPVPVGVVGELCFGGVQVARGYLDRPGLTAERFIPDPFAKRPGDRLYTTGDRGRFLPDGAIEYLGRTDHQLKIRGFRVELGEIETALAGHASLREAVVVAHEDRSGNKRLVAYVLSDSDVEALVEELRAFLKERLPDYMIPALFVQLESLPLTPSGKIARAQLPAPDFSLLGHEAGFVSPRTPHEELLAQVWARLLNVERVGVHDDFFELGGHSLLATRVVARVLEVFGVQIPVRSLFEASTVAELARVIEALQAEKDGVAAPAITPAEDRTELPLSFSQERLWFLDRLDPGTHAYNLPTAVRVTGPLRPTLLQATLDEIVRRHDVLRTTFHESDDGRPVQKVSEGGADFAVVDLAGVPEQRVADVVGRLAEREARRPFDLGRDRLMRTHVLRLRPEEHVVLFTMHHIASDGWSEGILVRELVTLYEAYEDGAPSRLPELPLRYGDYAAWQRGWLDGAPLEAQVSYWHSALAGAPPLLELPTDRPRPPVQTFAGARHPFPIPADVLDGLRALGREEGATLFMTLLAAFAAMLHRYTGERDVVVGAPIAGRTRPEVDGLIGFFVNTLALRVPVDGGTSFRALVRSARETALAAYAHQDVPFERLVDELHPDRDLSRSPIFQVMLVLQNAPMEDLAFSALHLSPLASAADTAKFDLTFSAIETGDGVAGTLEYNTDLFDAATVKRMADHLGAFLREVARAPDARVADVDILSGDERSQLVEAWNPAPAAPPGTASLAERFEAQVDRAPDRVAVEQSGASLTYAALNARANALARELRARGVGPDTLVGLYLERSPEMVEAILAVAKAGGAYLPLDPAHPEARLSFVLEDAEPAVVLASPGLAGSLPLPAERVLALTSDRPSTPADGPNLAGPVDPGQLAYVIYTSGSTGRPKGAMIHSGALASYLEWAAAHYEASEGGGSVVHSPLGFDLTVTSLLVPLVAGQTVHLLEDDVAPEELGRAMARYPDATLLKLTPSHLTLLADQLGEASVATLTRRLVVGGDALPSDTVRFWQRHAPRTLIVNEYGPTETVVGCCIHEIAADDDVGASVPIGRPIEPARLHVCDRSGGLVPVGVSGELLIGGAGVSRGYLKRPELTAEAFVPDPFGARGGERLYRTGDLSRRLPDGTLDFQGRLDHQVKIRGYRIELGEVEAALDQHQAVEQVVVVDRPDAAGGLRMVAYVVGPVGAEGGGGADELRTHLGALLPQYMVPSAFVFLDEMPLTANGKIDRAGLPDPAPAGSGIGFVAPRDRHEELIAGVWSEVLGVERVGVHDDFFDLGGHSLLATQVLSRIRRAVEVDIPLRGLFEDPTVAGLAERLRALLGAEAGTAAPPLTAGPRHGALPLSFAQQRLWLLDRMSPGDPSYNVDAALRLTGHVDVGAMEQTVTEILRRQEVLRATFVETDGRPSQVIAPPEPHALRLADLRGIPEPARDAEALRLAGVEARSSFDLERGPLVRFLLLRVRDDDHVLVFTTHHIVSDGWSIGVLVAEFSRIYTELVAGRPSVLPELEIQYTDFARWQREWLRGEALEQQLAYWRRQLEGEPPRLSLPTDRPRPRAETFGGDTHTVLLPAELTEKVRDLGREEGATLFMTLLAAFSAQLHRYTGQDDILVGTDMANRNREEIEGLIGFFINLLVLRTDLSGHPTFRVLLGRVRETALEAYAHQDLPFDKLVEELRPERHLSDTPLFQVLFVLQNTPMSALELSDLRIEPLPSVMDTSKFDLAIFVGEGRDRISMTWQFKTDLFDKSTIERLARHFEVLLDGAVSDPDASVGELRMVEERKRRSRRRVAAEGVELGPEAESPSEGLGA